MGLGIDPATIYVALVVSTVAATVVLLWCHALNRQEKAPLWLAVGFGIGSVGNLLVGNRAELPEWLGIQIGAGLVLLAMAFIWVAARVFNGRPATYWVPLAGPALWILACRFPAFYETYDARVITVSMMAAAYALLAAREFAVLRDGLLTRVAVCGTLVVHATFVLLRIPFVLTDGIDGMPGFASAASWFGVATLEAMIFIQVLSFLVVTLTKERVESRLRDAAHTDVLTGLGNRRAFFQWSEAAVDRAFRTASPLAVIVFDLDRFKAINDRHGHPVGDTVLQAFAGTAMQRLRAGDFVARLGGEEFAATLPDTGGERACLVALQISQAFEAAVAAMARPELIGTVSAGVAELAHDTATLDDLLVAADRALYQAKAMGRGQVCLGAAPQPLPSDVPVAGSVEAA
jgi:diguanylate cyclase (GGDEF)-like protein